MFSQELSTCRARSLGQKTGTAPSWSRTLGSAPEGRGRLTTGGSSPFRSVARGCGESFIGGTLGVTPFRRLLRRHIPALGCSTPDEEGAPRDVQATRTTSPAAARSTRATATPEDPPQRRRHRHWQQEPLGVGTRRSRPTGIRGSLACRLSLTKSATPPLNLTVPVDVLDVRRRTSTTY